MFAASGDIFGKSRILLGNFRQIKCFPAPVGVPTLYPTAPQGWTGFWMDFDEFCIGFCDVWGGLLIIFDDV